LICGSRNSNLPFFFQPLLSPVKKHKRDGLFPLPDKPSIAVLPLSTMGGDPEQVFSPAE